MRITSTTEAGSIIRAIKPNPIPEIPEDEEVLNSQCED
jgi:hypothetical protein